MLKFRRDTQMIFPDPYASLNPKNENSWYYWLKVSIYMVWLLKRDRNQQVDELLKTVGLNSRIMHHVNPQRNFSGRPTSRIGIVKSNYS